MELPQSPAATEGVRLVENECRRKRAGGKESI